MARVGPLRSKLNKKAIKKELKWNVMDSLKPIAIISSLYGVNRMHFIPNTPLYVKWIFNIYSMACVLTSIVTLYIEWNNQSQIKYDVCLIKLWSLVEYIMTVATTLIYTSKYVDFVRNIEEIDGQIAPEEDNIHAHVCVQSLVLSAIVTLDHLGFILYQVVYENELYLNDVPTEVHNLMHEIQFIYFGTVLKIVDVRLKLINAQLGQGKKGSDETSLSTQALYDVYKSLYCCVNSMYMYMGFQMLLNVSVAFLKTLVVSSITLNGSQLKGISTQMLYLFVSLRYIPLLLWPCASCLGAENETSNMRFMLADRLASIDYDKKLRRSLKDFLLVTETSGFKVVLFGLIPIDILLPFEFYTLLVTYVVIILQFMKIM